MTFKVLLGLLLALLCLGFVSASVLSPSDSAVGGFDSSTLGGSYEELINAWYASGNVTRSMSVSGSNLLIVPFFSSDSQADNSTLQNGSACNLADIGLDTEYCMVSDELSQVAYVLSMGSNETAFEEAYNTIVATSSTNGVLPSWKVLVNESAGSITACDAQVNSNCDTASDASARFVLALLTAAYNTGFTNETMKAAYKSLGLRMADDMIQYEFDTTCHNISSSAEEVCYWYKSGSEVGITDSNSGYSGYYGDAALAMLAACHASGNLTFCDAAQGVWLNYYQASYPDGYDLGVDGFRVPPGKAFDWTFLADWANVSCTDTCSPAQWDTADAPRAASLGLLLYYAEVAGYESYFVNLSAYVQAWWAAYAVADLNNFVVQYAPDGTNVSGPQSGYRYQGWQAQLLMSNSTTNLNTSLRNALDHYNTATDTWDYTSAAGVYGQSFSMRALGTAIGLDESLWVAVTVPFWCLQESADEASSCGAVSSGSYFLGDAYLYVNYTKPFGATSDTRWEVKHGEGLAAYNITISDDCWSAHDYLLRLRFFSTASYVDVSQTYTGDSMPQCWDGSSWDDIGVSVTNSDTKTSFSSAVCSANLYDEDYSTSCSYFNSAQGGATGWFTCSNGISSVNGCYDANIYEESVYWRIDDGVNFRFVDENTGGLFSAATITAYITGDSFAYNFTTSNGTHREQSVGRDNYTLTYSAVGYDQREFEFTIYDASSSDTITVYLSDENDTSLVLANVKDRVGQPIEGATVNVYRRNLSSTNYYELEDCTTDNLGQCLLHLELYDVTYQFRIYYEGVQQLVTNDQKVLATSITFYLTLTDDELRDFFDSRNITGEVTFDNGTERFTYSAYSTFGDSVTNCLLVVGRTGGNTVTLVNNCSSFSPGSNTVTAVINTTQYSGVDEFIAKGVSYYGTGELIIDVLSIDNNAVARGLGGLGLFLFGFLIIGVVAFTGLWNPVIASLLAVSGLVLLNLIGLINLGLTVIGGLGVIVVVMIFLMNK